MDIKIKDEEFPYFEAMYNLVALNFPKECICGRTFKNELDYQLSTTSLGDAMDYRVLGMGFLFFRNHIYRSDERRNISNGDFSELREINCPIDVLEDDICGSTISLAVGKDEDSTKISELIDYVESRAKKEGVNEATIMNQVRTSYNRYLLSRDLHTLL
jgi:hypothetical protein